MSNLKWVAAWGNASSITDREAATFSKNITLRYPVKLCFDGEKLRFHFSNVTGTEVITLNNVWVANSSEKGVLSGESIPVLFGGKESVQIEPGTELVSDEVDFNVKRGQFVSVSIYLKDYTQMNTGVLTTGPLSGGKFCYGDYGRDESLPLKLSRSTAWTMFLNMIDVYTDSSNHALICYGDSITAQDWPDYLTLRCFDEDIRGVSIIRRAISGTRILREYDCITYAAYGACGRNRFEREMDVAGADSVIIQHGINDIIHPVGEEVNPFRPWSDMPTAKQLIDGVKEIYVSHARSLGYKVYSGTLLPIYGWRTYEPFRDDIRNEYNSYLRTSDDFDGCVDFDKAVRDSEHPERFGEGFDSGDHLHPSSAAYKAMAMAVDKNILLG